MFVLPSSRRALLRGASKLALLAAGVTVGSAAASARPSLVMVGDTYAPSAAGFGQKLTGGTGKTSAPIPLDGTTDRTYRFFIEPAAAAADTIPFYALGVGGQEIFFVNADGNRGQWQFGNTRKAAFAMAPNRRQEVRLVLRAAGGGSYETYLDGMLRDSGSYPVAQWSPNPSIGIAVGAVPNPIQPAFNGNGPLDDLWISKAARNGRGTFAVPAVPARSDADTVGLWPLDGNGWALGGGAATRFNLSLSPTMARAGQPVTVTVTPADGPWPAGVTLKPACAYVAGGFSGALAPAAGTVEPVSCTFTPAAGGYGLLDASGPNLASVQGPQGIISVQSTGLPPFLLRGRSGGHAAGDVVEACMGFALGEVPAGSVLQVTPAGGRPTVPVTVAAASTWPDGSVKVGKLRAKLPSALAAGATWGGALGVGGTFAGSPPELSGLPAIRLVVAPPSGSPFILDVRAAALSAPATAAGRRVAGRLLSNPCAAQVRTVAAVPPAACGSIGMAVVADVELRSDGSTWVDCWFRNETSGVGATTAAYTATLVQDGVTVFSKRVTGHSPFRAWGRLTGTKAGAPARRPAQLQVHVLVNYLADHGFLPRIDTQHAPLPARLARYASAMANPAWDAPLTNRDRDFSGREIRLSMPSPGGRPDIGMTTGHQAAWLSCGDQRAEDYVLGQAEDAGSIPWHALDAQADRGSGVYWRTAEHPGGWNDGRSKIRPTPLYTEASSGWEIDTAHQPSLSYVPFLLTGREAFRDELMAAATHAIISFWPGYKNDRDLLVQGASGVSPRASAWSMREIHYASICAPPGSTDEAYFAGAVGANLDYLLSSREAWKAVQGELYGYKEEGGLPDHTANFMQQYNCMVLALVGKQDPRAMAYAHTFNAHYLLGAFGRSDFSPILQAWIDMYVGNGSGGRVTSWAALKARHLARDPAGTRIAISGGFAWNSGGVYISLLVACLAGWADLGMPGALQRWREATGQTGPSNSAAYVTSGDGNGEDSGMTWSIVPRGATRV